MTKYVLLYGGGGLPETEAEQAAVMQAWMDWYAALGSAVVDAGNPFTSSAKKISSNGAVSDLSLGWTASGYTILAADSLEHAVEMAQGCPILRDGGEITVYETFNVMG
jgi:hypothetical protein